MTKILVAGAGQAACQLAISLRQGGFTGQIDLFGEEAHPPYERPPLSKEYLAGDKPLERILIRPPSFWEDKGVAVELGVNVAEVDAMAREVVLGILRDRGFEMPSHKTPLVVECDAADVETVREWFATRDERCRWNVVDVRAAKSTKKRTVRSESHL